MMINTQNNSPIAPLVGPKTAPMVSSKKVVPYFSVPLPVLWLSIGILPYWLYVNWKAIKDAKGLNLSALGRAFGMIFFIGDFFEHVLTDAKEQGYRGNTNHRSLRNQYVLFFVLSVFCMFGIASDGIAAVKQLFSVLFIGFWISKFYCLWQVNKALNFYVNRTTQQHLEMLAIEPSKPVYDFFDISFTRFVVFNFLTFGTYWMYWLYKNWQAVQRAERRNISPFWRSFFSIFFVYGLFKKIAQVVKDRGFQKNIAYGWLFAIYLGSIGYNVLPRVIWGGFSNKYSNMPPSMLLASLGLYWKFLIIGIAVYIFWLAFCIRPLQKAIRYYKTVAIRNYQPDTGFRRGEVILLLSTCLGILGVIACVGGVLFIANRIA